MKQSLKTTARRLLCACLAALCLAGLLPFAASCGNMSLTFEVGIGMPLPASITAMGVDIAAYVEGYENNTVTRAGTYSIPITDEKGKTHVLLLKVIDRTKPVVTPGHVYYALGMPLPRAEDFIGTIVEADNYEAYFEDPLPDLSSLGDYDVTFRVKDASGNKTGVLHSVVTVIRDVEPPQFITVPELSAYVGEAIAYRRGLVVKDNCCGDLDVNVDTSSVDPLTVGDYPVRYTVTDASGNAARAETVIHIYANRITEAQLDAKIDAVLRQITNSAMKTEAKLRAIYTYVQNNIAYVSDSDKSDWVRAAYDALFVSGTGDCFNYFAAAKAFLRRLGLEYREIQRTPGAADGTHYWLMVNLGDEQHPRWYHYDCTRMREGYDHSLLTDRQLNAYNRMRPGFYAYNASAYPSTATEIITKTPWLEPYY